MKLPSRWTPAAIKKAFDEGTEERTINGRKIRIVIDPALLIALTSWPKGRLHDRIKVGPWTANNELEARLVN